MNLSEMGGRHKIIGLAWLISWLTLTAWAEQPATASAPKALSTPTTASIKSEASPRWPELTSAQQQALSPLQKLWPEINQARKRKWLAVSSNFQDLPELEQQKLQDRMREWASMTEVERAQARLQYAHAQAIGVDERRQRWEAYLALSQEEREQLAQHRPRKPQGRSEEHTSELQSH